MSSFEKNYVSLLGTIPGTFAVVDGESKVTVVTKCGRKHGAKKKGITGKQQSYSQTSTAAAAGRAGQDLTVDPPLSHTLA